MADNSAQTGGDTIRDKDRAGVKTQIVGLDLGIGTATETLMSGSMPIARNTDSNRTFISLNYNSAAPPTTDALLTTLVLQRGATNTTGQTSVAVTSGKVLRLTSVVVGVRATVATLPYGLLTLRVNFTGAAVLASPAVYQVAVSGTAAAIGNTGVTVASIEDGLELSGTQQLGLSFSGNLASNVVSASLIGYEYTP